LLGIHAHRHRRLLGAIDDRGDAPLAAQAPGLVLAARVVLPRLRFYRLHRCHAHFFLFPKLVYENNVLTEVSSWMDWMARATSPAMESTLILGSLRPAAVSGMVLVTTTCSSRDLEMRSMAGPESTGCDAQAYTLRAPAPS